MNLIIFGPNGSGKGTQAHFLEQEFSLKHLETGAIFRYNVSNQTEMGKKVKAFVEQGSLVPDSVTTPMMLQALESIPPTMGWLLDGYPRNLTQAQSLVDELMMNDIHVDFLIELVLDRAIAKKRLLGRRACSHDISHNNNTEIATLLPTEGDLCRVCHAPLIMRADDADERAIDTRHDIYYDEESGTMAGLIYCKDALCTKGDATYIAIDASQDIDTVRSMLIERIA